MSSQPLSSQARGVSAGQWIGNRSDESNEGIGGLAGEQEVNNPGAKAFFIAVTYAVEQTGTPVDRLTRDDFLKAAAIAEESGDLKMTQRLLLLADDEALTQGDR